MPHDATLGLALRGRAKRSVPSSAFGKDALPLYKSAERNSVPDELPKLGPNVRRSSASNIIASGLLLADLALVVLYTSRPAFLSPLALVVVAAIGIAALLLQVRLQPEAASQNAKASRQRSLWLTALGVAFAVGAVIGDVLHLGSGFMLVTALATLVCFAAGGIALLNTIRKRRI